MSRSCDNLFEFGLHNVTGGPVGVWENGCQKQESNGIPLVVPAGDYLTDCYRCMTDLLRLTETSQLDDRQQANNIRLTAFLHLFVELFQNDYKSDAKRFYAKFGHILAGKESNKLFVDYLANSIKSGQLDKRLAKFRNTKTEITITEEYHRVLMRHLEVSTQQEQKVAADQQIIVFLFSGYEGQSFVSSDHQQPLQRYDHL